MSSFKKQKIIFWWSVSRLIGRFTSVVVEPWDNKNIFLASLVLGNLLAYVLAMLVEFPLTELMKIILEESEQKRSSSPPRYSEIEAELRSDEVTADA